MMKDIVAKQNKMMIGIQTKKNISKTFQKNTNRLTVYHKIYGNLLSFFVWMIFVIFIIEILEATYKNMSS